MFAYQQCAGTSFSSQSALTFNHRLALEPSVAAGIPVSERYVASTPARTRELPAGG